jgi:hypothetical protein
MTVQELADLDLIELNIRIPKFVQASIWLHNELSMDPRVLYEGPTCQTSIAKVARELEAHDAIHRALKKANSK